MKQSVLKQVAELPDLDSEQLKERWRALFGSEPPAYNKSYLVKRLAYRIQELAYGGLSEAALAQLREALDQDDTDGNATRMQRRRRKPGMPVVGTRLVREWQGNRYEVTVVSGGFEFEGRKYRSLTAVTKAITGTHWNGPGFFGLRKPVGKAGS
jgi:hypothetical protein